MKNKITTFLFVIYIFTFSILGIILKDDIISYTERRKLTTFPKFTFSNEYVSKLDKYTLDQFPLRNTFRSIKAVFNYNILNKLDNNQIYLKDDYIFKSNYPTNKESIKKFTNYIESIKSKLTEDNNVYLMIIPDKNYYLESNDFLHIDYDYIYNQINTLDITNIDIRDIMTLNDYYQTDTHWRQENLDKVVKKMSEIIGFTYENIIYNKHIYNNFYGVYYGESALKRKPEPLTYLTNDILENAEVSYLENESLNKIYNLENLESTDSYEVYLDGASSFIEITNKNSQTKKELVIYRDSFASSITPLLVNYYSKITLIDSRYIASNQYKDLIEFTNQDVLFMYSTLIVNNSSSLKK